MLTGGIALPLIGLNILMIYAFFLLISHLISDPQRLSLFFPLGVIVILGGGVDLFALYSPLMYDWFNYRHAPIRFNRRTRQVHVFYTPRFGGPRSYDWDEIAALIIEGRDKGRQGGRPDYHVLTLIAVTPDQKHYYDSVEIGDQIVLYEYCLAWWEYIRRFMEEGSESIPEPDWTLSERLSLRESFLRWFPLREMRRDHASGLNIRPAIVRMVLMSPFLTLFSIGHFISMLTSRHVQWPQEIRQACGEA